MPALPGLIVVLVLLALGLWILGQFPLDATIMRIIRVIIIVIAVILAMNFLIALLFGVTIFHSPMLTTR